MDTSDDELRAFALALCVEFNVNVNVKVTGAESLDYLLDAITIRPWKLLKQSIRSLLLSSGSI